MPKYPKPRTEKPLIAPNEQAEVQYTIDHHPEIDTMDEEARGEIIDITARRLNPGGGERPWGRKARHNNPSSPNLNTDAMTFLRPDGLFEIYDVISGIDGQATWDPYGPFSQGENGYWWPPNEVEDGSNGSGGGDEGGGDTSALEDRVTALEQENQALHEEINTLTDRVTAVESRQAEPLHAHGPVNLPLVFQDLTHLRAKGDIDVEVKIGEATPPATDPDEGVSRDELVKFLLIRRQRDDDDEAPPQ